MTIIKNTIICVTLADMLVIFFCLSQSLAFSQSVILSPSITYYFPVLMINHLPLPVPTADTINSGVIGSDWVQSRLLQLRSPFHTVSYISLLGLWLLSGCHWPVLTAFTHSYEYQDSLLFDACPCCCWNPDRWQQHTINSQQMARRRRFVGWMVYLMFNIIQMMDCLRAGQEVRISQYLS